jgi:hypothetical protein
MITSTFLAVFFVPVFFVTFQALVELLYGRPKAIATSDDVPVAAEDHEHRPAAPVEPSNGAAREARPLTEVHAANQ